MLKSFKTEIDPAEEQKQKINQNLGVCRFIYNFYISYNKEMYEKEKKFISAYDFSNYINNEFLPNNPEYMWIKDAYGASVTRSMVNAETAFKNFFKGKSGFPKYKKKCDSNTTMYFYPQHNPIKCERHRIKVPKIGWVKIKEKGYIPLNDENHTIKNVHISKKADRYYASVMVEIKDTEIEKPIGDGIGIDLGVKDFAICSNGMIFPNINKTEKMRKLEKQLKREQRCLSRKFEDKKKNKNKELEYHNIEKQKLKIQKLHQRINNVRTDYINKVINEIVKAKPSYITVEDLNVSGMVKNKHLSKAISEQNFFTFKAKLSAKCNEYGIELRLVDRFYPSSKLCSSCGNIKKDLKLSERTYKCEHCGNILDRDFNASVNLKNATEYTVA